MRVCENSSVSVTRNNTTTIKTDITITFTCVIRGNYPHKELQLLLGVDHSLEGRRGRQRLVLLRRAFLTPL